MTDEPNRADIETAREELLDKLGIAKQRRTQIAYAVAMGKAEEVKLTEADQSVRGIEQKLEGLVYGLERVSEQEEERQAAERLARRRETAVEVLLLMQHRLQDTVALDAARAAQDEMIERLERTGQHIYALVSGCFGSDLQGQDKFRNFMMNIDALDLTDTVYRMRNDIDFRGSYAKSVRSKRPAAIAALSQAFPEVLDEAVREEALARAREEDEADRAARERERAA